MIYNMRAFQRIVFLSILGTYLVILAGSIVRGTGSGLGCPDWPRCFGQWIPPVEISELPENYKEIYKIAGKTIADFDPFKTWTEYINRLLGVLLGFLIVILFGLSFKLKNYERNLPWFCGGLLFLIIVQGGVGALVVSTHLRPYIITIHMFLAIVLLFGLLYLRKYCKDLHNTSIIQKVDQRGVFLSRILITMAFIQVLLGTQVRQQVDHYMRDTLEATSATIMNFMGWVFYIHRSFSILIVFMFLYVLVYFHRSRFNRSAFFLGLLSFLCVMGNVVSGIILNYFGFPAGAQPFHLFFGVLSLGLLYSLSLSLRGTLLED
jgi:cytochrome c oxidase assembly protein subunit 15